MAILGYEGYVRFRREVPDPIVVPVSALRGDLDKISVESADFWNGDEVYVSGLNGIPISTDAVPDGVGCYYGSFWELGQNRIHVLAEDDEYYVSSDDSVAFYNIGDIVQSGVYFISRDQLGRVSFYPTRSEALAGTATGRVDLAQVDFVSLVIAAAGTQEYNDAVTECLAAGNLDYRLSDINDEVTLESICDYSPGYLKPLAGTAEYDDADVRPRRSVGGLPWFVQGELREWSIELNGDNVETTAVGQKFGESVKSIVSGGGTFDFLVDRRTDEERYDPTALMQLLLMTEKGAKAEAQFFMITDREENCRGLAPGDLFYECDVLITNTAINTRTEGLIVGTAQFVTTGAIQLKMGQ